MTMRGTARLNRLVRRLKPPAPVRIETPEEEAAAFKAAGDVLSAPTDDAKGVFLVNGTRLRFYEPLAAKIRAKYAAVLVHFWEIDRERLAQYRRAAPLFDAVVSPNAEYDARLAFGPIYRSNGMDLLVDDTLWPLLDLPRDIEVAASTSVPWALKRPLVWLAETQAHLDRIGGGRAFYLTKREPGEKEDAACHREWARFRENVSRDDRIELRIRSSLADVVRILNRTKYLFHPSTSEFAPRALIEALYCGAVGVAGAYDWVETVSTRAEVRERVLVRERLVQLPEHKVIDIRRWQTTRGLREGLVDFLAEHGHQVNPAVATFSLFSSKRIDRPPESW
jgi:hypothetical protein